VPEAESSGGVWADDETGVSVVADLPREELLPGHHAPSSIYLGPGDAPGVGFKIAAADAAQFVGRPLADLHAHEVDEVYLVVTPGLHFDVETDRGSVEVRSPVSVRIPAGTPHRFVVREARTSPCPFLAILLESSS